MAVAELAAPVRFPGLSQSALGTVVPNLRWLQLLGSGKVTWMQQIQELAPGKVDHWLYGS